MNVEVVDSGWVVAGALVPGIDKKYPERRRMKEQFWKFIVSEFAPATAHQSTLLIGDLNTGLHFIDEKGATLVCAEDMAALRDAGWIDVWHALHPDDRPPPTWWYNAANALRLDHAFLSPSSPPALKIAYPSEINGMPATRAGVPKSTTERPPVIRPRTRSCGSRRHPLSASADSSAGRENQPCHHGSSHAPQSHSLGDTHPCQSMTRNRRYSAPITCARPWTPPCARVTTLTPWPRSPAVCRVPSTAHRPSPPNGDGTCMVGRESPPHGGGSLACSACQFPPPNGRDVDDVPADPTYRHGRFLTPGS